MGQTMTYYVRNLLVVTFQILLPPWFGKEGYVFGSIGLSVCSFVSEHYSKTYEQIGMKLSPRLLGGTMKN